MVVFGSLVSRQAHGDYALLLTMSFIEVSLATALLGSSVAFGKKSSHVAGLRSRHSKKSSRTKGAVAFI